MLPSKLLSRSEAVLENIPLSYQRKLIEEIDWNDPLIAVIGPRGVGKTTLLGQKLAELQLPPTQALYLDLGDIAFADLNLLDLAESFLEGGGQYLFLDEVHRYPRNWAAEIKSLYDYYRQRLKVVFSGSSILKILNNSADLSRRVQFHHLPGLSFREYLLLVENLSFDTVELKELLDNHLEIAFEIRKKLPSNFLSLFQDYLKYGYYAFTIEGISGYQNRVNAMVQLVLTNDIPYATESRSAHANKLSRLLQAIASSVPFKPNITKLSERVELSRVTLLEYLQLLQRANLIQLLSADGKGISTLAKPDKIYLDNTNLIHVLAPNTAEAGTVRETFFFNQLSHLRNRVLAFQPEISLPKKGDFIYQYQGDRFVFEVSGPNKTADQIGRDTNHFTVVDDKASASPHRIPLWLFGLLY
ncbi:MAG: AAA family ATPase [Bacteroidota bacterium]